MIVACLLLSGAWTVVSGSVQVMHRKVQSVQAGGNVTFSCRLITNEDALQVTWQKEMEGTDDNIATYSTVNGQKIVKSYGSHVSFALSELQASAISLQGVTFQDEGCYKCIFNTFPSGAVTGRMCLKVYAISDPKVEAKLIPSPDKAKGNVKVVEMSCSATGKPAPKITWQLPSTLQQKPREYHVRVSNQTVTVISNFTLTHSKVLQEYPVTCMIQHPSLNVTLALPTDSLMQGQDSTIAPAVATAVGVLVPLISLLLLGFLFWHCLRQLHDPERHRARPCWVLPVCTKDKCGKYKVTGKQAPTVPPISGAPLNTLRLIFPAPVAAALPFLLSKGLPFPGPRPRGARGGRQKKGKFGDSKGPGSAVAPRSFQPPPVPPAFFNSNPCSHAARKRQEPCSWWWGQSHTERPCHDDLEVKSGSPVDSSEAQMVPVDPFSCKEATLQDAGAGVLSGRRCLAVRPGQESLEEAVKSENIVVAALGGEADLYCNFTLTMDVLQVTWQKRNGSLFENIATYSQNHGLTLMGSFQKKARLTRAGLKASVITMQNLTLEDESYYRCIFNVFPHGSLSKDICLNVQTVSELIVEYNPHLDTEGLLTAVCSATGKPPPQITWLGGEDLDETSKVHHVQNANGTSVFYLPAPEKETYKDLGKSWQKAELSQNLVKKEIDET
nr:PREDICTED: uncharacterized protein LOC104144291 [Struthio camelus australis]